MIVALIDNGSLEPAAHLNLRTVASALSEKVGVKVSAVSWKHSDRVAASSLGGEAASTLAPWIRTQLSQGEREFVFVPFFISDQGAIGSALRNDLEKLRRENSPSADFQFVFADGLASRGAITGIVADRVRETIAHAGLHQPSVLVVDHGGPSAASAALRDAVAEELRVLLCGEIRQLSAASMEGAHGPLLAEQLCARDFNHGDVVIASLFLSPGRHAGPHGDVSAICRTAETVSPALHCHMAGLVGTHPRVVETLALALRETLSHLHATSLV